MSILSRRRLVQTCLAVSLLPTLLSGCGEGTDASKSQESAPWRDGGVKNAAAAWTQITASAKGISVGSERAPRTAYVIFDPRCSHCAKLWLAAQPLVKDGSARFVWVPVGLSSKDSTILAAAIWDSPDPLAAMQTNEQSINEKTGGLKLTGKPSDAAMAVIQSNAALAQSIGLQEVPLLLVKTTRGDVVLTAGSMKTYRLREFLAQ